MSGITAHRDDPRIIEARERFKRYAGAAVANLQKLLSGRGLRAS